jgi:hypothetical protein
MNKSWGYTSLITNQSLLEQLRNIKGLFCMSYDFSEHNMELFDEFNIEIFDNTYSINSFDSRKKAREIIIMNY